MNKNQQTIVFNIEAEISRVKQAAKEMEKSFSNLNLSQSMQKSLDKIFSKLNEEIKNFEIQSSKGFSSLADTSKAEKNINNIVTLFENLKIQIKDLNNSDLKKILPSQNIENLKTYKKILQDIEKLQSKDNSTEIKKASNEVNKQKKAYEDAKASAEGFAAAKKHADSVKGGHKKQYNELTRQIDAAKKSLAEFIEEEKKDNKSDRQIANTLRYKELNTQIKDLTEKRKIHATVIDRETKNASDAENSLAKIIPSVSNLKKQYEEAEKALAKLTGESSVSQQELDKLADKIAKIGNIDINEVPKDLQGMSDKIKELISEEDDVSKIADILRKILNQANETQEPLSGMRDRLNEVGESHKKIAQINSEMDQLKSRLTYFFSAMNGIQLFKNAIRSAYESVKELDSAITEMAVVTDYSINDIWGNIPQYTKTAKELGATTKDVINSMVLYTQQGLDMAQATELSAETMKMARIAGLEGAEATDLRKHWVFI